MPGQWWESIEALLPTEAKAALPEFSSKASSISDDTCHSEAQAAVARTLIADIMVAQTEDKETALWTDVDLDLNLAELHSADVNQVVAKVFTQLTASSPAESEGRSARALARSPEDGLHSEIAQELSFQILAKQAPSSQGAEMSESAAPSQILGAITTLASPPATHWQSEALESSQTALAPLASFELPKSELSVQLSVSDTDSLVAQIAKRALGSPSGSQLAPLAEPDLEQASNEGAAEHVARDVVSIVSRPPEASRHASSSTSQHDLSDGNTDSIVARSIARQAVGPLLSELRLSAGNEQPEDAVQDLGLERFFEDAISAAVVRDVVWTPHQGMHMNEESDLEPCENTDSMVAVSVARQAIGPHLAHTPQHRSHGVEEVEEPAPSDADFGAHAVARDLVTSASRQQAEEQRGRASPDSQHQVSENTDSMVANSIARQAVMPHLADSDSATPPQRSHAAGVEEVLGPAPADVDFGAHALARDLVTSASRQQAEEQRGQASPDSQHQVSENTDSMVANSIARQAAMSHLADSDSATPPQRSHAAGVEEVLGPAPADVDFGAHALARDLVTSASRQQAEEQRGRASPDSRHQVSENTDSMVANSIARQAVMSHLADSDSATPPQRSHAAGVEEVMGPAPADVDFGAHAVARDLVTSASRQQAEERRGQASPDSRHQVSENTGSMVANSIARQAVMPHLADSDSATPPQRSHAAGVEEVLGPAPADVDFGAHAVARDLVTSASRQQAEEQRGQASPDSQHQVSENTDSMVANSIARQAVMSHLADSDSATPPQRSHAAGVEEVMGPAPADVDFGAHALARDLVTFASQQQAEERRGQASPDSRHQVSENTDSMVANSIARQAVMPHLADSDSATPPQRSHAAGVEEVLGPAPADVDFGAHAVARDLVTSASRQQAEERRGQASPDSRHQVSENTGSMVADSIARQAVMPHLADSDSATPPQRSHAAGVEEVLGPAPADVDFGAHALARDLVTSASRQQAEEQRGQASPDSQHQVSENTDSMVANSIARQAVMSHLADSDSATPPQRSHAAGVEEVMGPAPADVDFGAHALARDLVTFASQQQAEERRGQASPDSRHQVSENTDSMVANSIARQAVMPHLADSDSATPPQRSHAAGVEEVLGPAPADVDFGAHALARDLVTSASQQQAEERRGQASPDSRHQVSENTDSMVANSIARQAVMPHLTDSDSATPPQRSHAAGVEEVLGLASSDADFSAQILARELFNSAADVSDEKTPSVQLEPSEAGHARAVAFQTVAMLSDSVGLAQSSARVRGPDGQLQVPENMSPVRVPAPSSQVSRVSETDAGYVYPAVAEMTVLARRLEQEGMHSEGVEVLQEEVQPAPSNPLMELVAGGLHDNRDASPASVGVSEGSVDARSLVHEALALSEARP